MSGRYDPVGGGPSRPGALAATTFWPYSGFPEKAPNPQNQLSRCPKKRIKIPETGLLLTQAVKSEGTNGFSAIELPHVMPVGASQHHKTMPEDAHLPRAPLALFEVFCPPYDRSVRAPPRNHCPNPVPAYSDCSNVPHALAT